MTHLRHTDPLPLGGDASLPYSKGLMARALMAAGVSAAHAYELARSLELELADSDNQPIAPDRLRTLATRVLGPESGADAVDRLNRYRRLQEFDLPIILLIGGGTGTGKSTVATEAAYRLGITRVTSTDFVRQTMRAFFSPEFMPSVHYSSFEAGRHLREGERTGEQGDVIRGFLDQAGNVLVGVKAATDRALQEGFSMVLEGVHLVPGLLPRVIEGALVVQCVLAIDDHEAHAGHFWSRDAASEGLRPLERYLEAFDDIRLVQSYILERAQAYGVPVIQNASVDRAIAAVMDLVLSGAEQIATVAR